VLAFSTVLEEGNGAAVVFSIGSQKRIDQWYQHLREVEPGVRQFGGAGVMVERPGLRLRITPNPSFQAVGQLGERRHRRAIPLL